MVGTSNLGSWNGHWNQRRCVNATNAWTFFWFFLGENDGNPLVIHWNVGTQETGLHRYKAGWRHRTARYSYQNRCWLAGGVFLTLYFHNAGSSFSELDMSWPLITWPRWLSPPKMFDSCLKLPLLQSMDWFKGFFLQENHGKLIFDWKIHGFR